MRDMDFAFCPVTNALGPVSQRYRAGNKVVFNPPWDPEGSCIERVEIGEYGPTKPPAKDRMTRQIGCRPPPYSIGKIVGSKN